MKDLEEKMVLLFQKELLLENLLSVLDTNEIDINTILYSAFESIQSENYMPKTGQSLIEDGYFVLKDKVKHPPKAKEPSSLLKKNLKLNLNFL